MKLIKGSLSLLTLKKQKIKNGKKSFDYFLNHVWQTRQIRCYCNRLNKCFKNS